MGFLEQVRTSCGPQSLSKHRMPGLGVGVWFLWGLKNIPQLHPGEHRTVGGSQRTLGHTSVRDTGLTWLTAGPAGVGGADRRYGFFGTSPHLVRTSESLKA